MSIANQPKRRLTVTSAAADQLLCTVANAKIDIGISGSTEDAYLTRLVAQSSKMIANYCGRVFKRETVTETFEVTYPAGILMLSRYPLGTITSVKIDGVAILAANYHAETNTGYLRQLDDNGRTICWDCGLVEVVYQGGFSSIPEDLEAACIALVKARRATRDRDATVRSEEVPDVYRVSFDSGSSSGELPAEVTAVLDQYIPARY